MGSPDGEPGPRELLGEVLDDPEGGKQRLPYAVGLFESENRTTRLCAAWTCCYLATELDDEDAIEYVVRRLSDRLDEEHVSLELTAALDYISTRHPEQVERILEEMADDRQESGDVPLPRVGEFTRNHYYNTEVSERGVGRTRIAGQDAEDSPRRAYADSPDREGAAERDPEPAAEQTGGEGEDESDEGTAGGSSGDESVLARERTAISSIAARSRFEKLHILASRRRDRYADVYDALVAQGGEEMAVALRLFHQPDSGDRPDYQRRVRTALSGWDGIDDHDHVVTLLDWGVEPRPWMATPVTGVTLAEKNPRPVDAGLGEAVSLAEALSYAHRNGCVHAGLDPRNVVYPGDVLEGGERMVPTVDNVGLLSAFRFHFEPSLCLDPRFAAPEYYDEGYGRIDHATDIYHLGAVLYRLFTGRPPFSGTFAEVRESVLEDQPAPPSEMIDTLSPALDDVILKAMAKQKLTRYEAVEHVQQELTSIRSETDG